MNVFKQDDDNELSAQIKQLVIGFTSHIHDVESINDAQNTYLHMEEYDRDFDRYKLVKTLRASIDEAVGSLINNEIDRRTPGPGQSLAEQESLITDITNKVLHSRNYVDLVRRVRDKVERTCEYLQANFENEFLPNGDDSAFASKQSGLDQADRHNLADGFFSDVEAESSIGDSLNQSGVIFMNSHKQQRIADDLNKSNSVDVRLSAIKELFQVTSSLDVQTCEQWPAISVGVRDALLDDEESLWMLGLRFIARGLSTNCIEMYQVLVEYLHALFSPSYSHTLPSVRDGLNVAKPRVGKVLKSFRLLNSFLQLAPHYSQRYQIGTLNSILELTLTFLDSSCPASSTERFMPMHFLSVVDIRATWLVNLMHSQFSRACTLGLLEQHSSLVDSAINSCLTFITAHVDQDSIGDGGDTPRSWRSNSQRFHYTRPEVEYAHFLHSLRFVGRLLQYERGRRFFTAVSVSQMIVAIVQLATRLPRAYKPQEQAVDPHQLAVDILKKLCSNEDACQKLMCCDAVSDVLLEPFKRHLDSRATTSKDHLVSEPVVANVVAILSSIAATRCGHQHLLYREGFDWRTATDESQSAALVHVIVKFAVKKLSSDHNADDDSLSRDVLSDLLNVCRLFYHTCEGLLIVGQYDLHRHLTSAWQDARRVVDNITPTPTPTGGDVRDEIKWEQQLNDDLLNFAWTEKGVMLLQQTGTLAECVAFMYPRYVRKLQVSNCKKFGCGYMMSQVSATAPGIIALDRSGFTGTLIRVLWSTVEVVDEGLPYVPRCWPVSAIDKLAKKPFASLINSLSSFLSVYEILEHDRTEPSSVDAHEGSESSRHIPCTIGELLDRLVFIDSDEKITSLFNYEQSHVFGLRLLSVMTSCLDTMLLLQQKYSFQQLLLRCQSENVAAEGSQIILDMLSMERNYILVKTYAIGGPTERHLPPPTITGENESLLCPLFSCYPIPKEYFIKKNRVARNDKSELAKLTAASKKTSSRQLWLEKAQGLLVSELTSAAAAVFDVRVLYDFLEKVVESKIECSSDVLFQQVKLSDSWSNKSPLSATQHHGIGLAVRYGCQLQLLQSEKEGVDKLSRVIRKLSTAFQQHTADLGSTGLACLKADSSHVGFDWFAATVFLMASGNADRAEKFLSKFSALSASGFIWTKRLHGSVHMNRELAVTGMPPVYFVVCHHVEHILQLELPHVYSAFKMSGYSPAQICQHWLRQCFWNYLDWPQVCEFVALCVTVGSDYAVYACVAVLRHLQHDLMQHLQDKNLIVFLKEQPVRNFRFGGSLDFMQHLQRRFGGVITCDMQSIAA